MPTEPTTPRPPAKELISEAIDLVWSEREHQVSKGYSAAHDDQHRKGELSDAAFAFQLTTLGPIGKGAASVWPWPRREFKPRSAPIDNLIVCAAFLLAEIERRLRAGERPTP